ncbi:hypothetical protein PROH_20315 [Prochlorothrix hollandica PCC 9006 = CALU 1027]|uniref:Sulfotransferase family protein n=2 Tax=Prochlorothrix hollandica TaxID=1223 RepID=A0A0M2PUD2_PROHO|nr:hypothetical protein PROH_20315 [Prochlorothrix hollandica PCC 9006 = CALU 1027]
MRKLVLVADHGRQDLGRWLGQRQQWARIVNQREIRLVGMRRTGNHALSQWLQAQMEGTVLYCNNLEVLESPYRHKYEVLRDHFSQHRQVMERFHQESLGHFSPKDWLLYSYEDHDLGRVVHPYFEVKHDLYLGRSQTRHDVLVLRDPFNLFASRLKSQMQPVRNPRRTMVDLWLAYAREFVGETRYLRHNPRCISYNQWVQDRDYRQGIAQGLGLVFSDRGLQQVSGCGNGSSFDGQGFQGNAQAMAVFDRWHHCAEDPRFRACFQDPAVWAYSDRIFGEMPGTEVLRPTTWI